MSDAPRESPPASHSPRAGQRSGGRAAANVLLVLIIAFAGYQYWNKRAVRPEPPRPGTVQSSVDSTQPAPPRPTLRETADDARFAAFQSDELLAFCAAHELPPLPPLADLEPAVADTLAAALERVARTRDGATVGRLGQILYALEFHRAAETYFTLARTLDPAEDRWPYLLGCIAQAEGRAAAAVEHFEFIARRSGAYGMLFARLAHLYIDAARWDEAQKAAEEYVRFQPGDSLGYIVQARVAMQRKQWPVASERLELARKYPGPNDFQVYSYLGRVRAALGDAAAAEQAYAESRKYPPGEYFTYRDAWILEALASSGSRIPALEAELAAAEKTRDARRIVEVGREIAQVRPRDATLIAKLALNCCQLRRFDDARKWTDRGRALKPEWPAWAIAQCQIDLAAGRVAEAERLARELIEQRVSDAAVMQGREWLVRALIAAQRLDEAKAVIDELSGGEPTATREYLTGEWHAASSRPAEAAAAYRRAVALDPQHAAAKAALASPARKAKR